MEVLDSFSGHADHSELVDYFTAMSGKKTKTWLVHGEPDHAEALQMALREVHDGDIEIAVLGHEVEF